MANIMKICLNIFIGFLLILTLTLPITTYGAAVHRKRATDEAKSECTINSPCGWAVYSPKTRQVDFFMKNTCECSPKTQCIRTDDDLSVSAYVYRCRETVKKDESTLK